MSETIERDAFPRWWEGQANWTGSPCAVAYQGWLARAEKARAENPLQNAVNGWVAAHHGQAHQANVNTHDWNPDPALRRVGTYCRSCKCAEASAEARKPCPSQGGV